MKGFLTVPLWRSSSLVTSVDIGTVFALRVEMQRLYTLTIQSRK